MFKAKKHEPVIPLSIAEVKVEHSTNCFTCEHRDCCKYKRKFTEQQKALYPLVCKCELYKATITMRLEKI